MAGYAAQAVSDIGIIGSGVMGSNLGLNIADKSRFAQFEAFLECSQGI